MTVIGIGQCSLDHLALIDAFPNSDTKKEVLEWVEQGGGPVATALVALSRLGIKCSFYGVVGDDPEGSMIRRSFESEGVDAGGLVVRKQSRSQVAFITVEKGNGRRTIFWKRPSGMPLKSEELREGFLHGASFLLLDGLMWECSLFAARRARAAGIPVMLDAGRVRQGTLEIARNADYLVASEGFAQDMRWDRDDARFVRESKALGVKAATITLGERGSITAIDDKVLRVPAFTVETLDTTGAGDVFHGGYVYGILQGWDLVSAIRFSSAFAAMKCTMIGGRAGIPQLNGVLQFLRQRGESLSGRLISEL